jgi:hypothetical protein
VKWDRGGVALPGLLNTVSYFTVLDFLLETVHVLLFIILKAYLFMLSSECGAWI